jgi:hypothetical protein
LHNAQIHDEVDVDVGMQVTACDTGVQTEMGSKEIGTQ